MVNHENREEKNWHVYRICLLYRRGFIELMPPNSLPPHWGERHEIENREGFEVYLISYLTANSLYVNTFNTMIHDSSTPQGKHATNYFEPCTPSSGCQWISMNTLMFDVLRSDTQLRQGNMLQLF